MALRLVGSLAACSLIGRVVLARARTPTRIRPVRIAPTRAQTRAYGGVGVRRIGLGASGERHNFRFYFWLGLGSAIRSRAHSRRASLSALQASSPRRSVT